MPFFPKLHQQDGGRVSGDQSNCFRSATRGETTNASSRHLVSRLLVDHSETEKRDETWSVAALVTVNFFWDLRFVFFSISIFWQMDSRSLSFALLWIASLTPGGGWEGDNPRLTTMALSHAKEELSFSHCTEGGLWLAETQSVQHAGDLEGTRRKLCPLSCCCCCCQCFVRACVCVCFHSFFFLFYVWLLLVLLLSADLAAKWSELTTGCITTSCFTTC